MRQAAAFERSENIPQAQREAIRHRIASAEEFERMMADLQDFLKELSEYKRKRSHQYMFSLL